jgi:hypothetical protein
MQEQGIRMEGLVANGLAFLAEGLTPFLDKVMSRKLGTEKWFEAFCQNEPALTKFGHNGRAPKKSDLAFQLKLLLDGQYVDIHRELGYEGKILCIQLRNDRNNWCHNGSSAPREAFVTLDRIEKMLSLIKADSHARQVADLLLQVQQEMAHQLDGEVNHPMHAASHAQQASESDYTVPSEPECTQGDELDPNSDEHLIWLLEWSGFELRVEDIKVLGLEDGQRRRIVDKINDLSMRYDDAVEEAIYHPWKSVERLTSSFRKAAAEIIRSEVPPRRLLAATLASKRLAVALEIEM